MLLVFGFAPEVIRQRTANRQNGKHLDKVGKRRGIFKRVRGIGIHVTAAVGAQHFDGDLRCYRSLHNGLRRVCLIDHDSIAFGIHDRFAVRIVLLDGNHLWLNDGGRGVRLEILNHALRDEKQRIHDANWQQQIISDAREVHPEVADGF